MYLTITILYFIFQVLFQFFLSLYSISLLSIKFLVYKQRCIAQVVLKITLSKPQ